MLHIYVCIHLLYLYSFVNSFHCYVIFEFLSNIFSNVVCVLYRMCSFSWVLKVNFLFSNSSFSCLSVLFFLCFKFLVLRNITFLSQRTVNILILKSLNTFLFLFCLERVHVLIISFVVFLIIKLLWSSGVWIAYFPGPLPSTQCESWAVACALHFKASGLKPGLAAWMPSLEGQCAAQFRSWGYVYVLLPLWVHALHEL